MLSSVICLFVQDAVSRSGRPPPQEEMMRPAARAAIIRDMTKKKRMLAATLADGYVKVIGPTAAPFTHYWRIVAHLQNGKTEIFWGHTKSLREANAKRAATADAARQRGWRSYDFEVVELVEC